MVKPPYSWALQVPFWVLQNGSWGHQLYAQRSDEPLTKQHMNSLYRVTKLHMFGVWGYHRPSSKACPGSRRTKCTIHSSAIGVPLLRPGRDLTTQIIPELKFICACLSDSLSSCHACAQSSGKGASGLLVLPRDSQDTQLNPWVDLEKGAAVYTRGIESDHQKRRFGALHTASTALVTESASDGLA